VAELVQQERGEEEKRRRDGQRKVLAVREAGILGWEDRCRERPDDEREDNQPAPVEADPDSGDPTQLDRRVHKTQP